MNKRWYKDSVVYQIYPRSFQDSNGDGVGDIRGIISRLDYLVTLGVNVVWLSPIYESPLDDNGYDISDYRSILKEYGTINDFKEMLDEMHKRNIKLIMDLVVNHTSDEHNWFKEAMKDKNSPYHDYYIFKDNINNKLPNNWKSFFGGSAWELNLSTNEFYLHLFTKKQPDLNWENPKVREEIKSILRYWLDMGVDGFRCDVINLLSKSEGLPNTHGIPILSGQGIYINGPKMHEYLQELKNDVFKNYDIFTVGECVLINPSKALEYVKEGTDELNMVFQFEHMGADNFLSRWIPRKFKLTKLKKALNRWQIALSKDAWNSLYIENHDQPRSVSRFGSIKYHKESAKMIATYYFLMKGTPYIYQGQEIGMTNASYNSIDEYNDVETHNMYRLLSKYLSKKRVMKIVKISSRDNARTPMQWNNQENAGFSTSEPWLGVNPNYEMINVDNNSIDEDSILNYYKKLIQFRKNNPVAIYGDYQEHFLNNHKFAFYERNYVIDNKNTKMLVLCNFSDKIVKIPKVYDLNIFTNVFKNYSYFQDGKLLPYQSLVYIKKDK